MSSEEEEIKLLKAEIELLKEVIKGEQAEREILKKELSENKKNDDKRHKEIKQIQKEQHQDNLKWNKIGAIGGAFGTPLALILPLIITWINKKPKQEKDKGLEKKIDRVLKILEQNCLEKEKLC